MNARVVDTFFFNRSINASLNPGADGQTKVKFGILFNDEHCANIFEALVGTLRAAKRRKLINFEGELLLQGVHDNVDIVLLQEWGQSLYRTVF